MAAAGERRQIKKIFIANRGEIAERIGRCCRRLGIEFVTAHVAEEEDRPYVRASSHSVLLSAAADFLSAATLVQLATASGCDAIHPGYGFLSESADFAAACEAAGLIWIGPPAEAIRAMGDKSSAKQLLASRAGDVPLIGGYCGDEQSYEVFEREAERVGYPVLLKAAAGGGGKGMRVVRRREELRAAMELAQSEALRSFGNATLLLEQYFEVVRHVEVQIVGDCHGALTHLYERECSVQRRHQKIIEESPSPLMTAELRAAMTSAAEAVGRLIGYSSAGTVEFIVDPRTRRFYFLEVNTRLQVEHPVTEQVTGVDLVELQIRVAERWRLDELLPALPPLRGHSIEVRLCAEDAARNFFPCVGRVALWRPADVEGVRYDTDLRTGVAVSIHFDSMLGKVIAHGASRAQALQRLTYALRHTALLGVVTNKDYLVGLLGHPLFASGDITTGFIDQHCQPTAVPLADSAAARTVFAVAACLFNWWQNEQRRPLRHIPSGWRNSRSARLHERRFAWSDLDSVQSAVHYRCCSRVTSTGSSTSSNTSGVLFDPVRIVHASTDTDTDVTSSHSVLFFPNAADAASISFAVDRQRYTCLVAVDRHTGALHMHCPDQAPLSSVVVAPVSPFGSAAAGADADAAAYVAPMPSKVLQVHVADGQQVDKGQVVLTIESMKMEVRIVARQPGTVSLNVAAGQQIDAGFEMFKID